MRVCFLERLDFFHVLSADIVKDDFTRFWIGRHVRDLSAGTGSILVGLRAFCCIQDGINLIFNRSISELSPLQIARLAAAAAELAGGSNSSLLDSLRKGTGLDDLDVTTDSEGNAGVKAGRYIRDNVYLGVEAGAGGKTKGTINLDVTPQLKAKGSVGSDGDSGAGVFFERDY